MTSRFQLAVITVALFAFATFVSLAADSTTVVPEAKWITYPPQAGPGEGRHIVFLTGDEEYRSEEGLPMLAKILSQRHGFKCTVLFSLNDDGTINPDNQKSLPGADAMGTADAIVMLLRFRQWPDSDMKHFADAMNRGVPIIGLRTATHAFNFPAGASTSYGAWSHGAAGGFGRKVLGETWVNHWGRHKVEATRGLIEQSAKDDPILNGVADVFGDSDVYEAYPPEDVKILMRGQVLKGMTATHAPAEYVKRRNRGDRAEQGINDPMMPVAWTRLHRNEAGTTNRVFTTTLGAATDLQSEGLRRMIVNSLYWGLNLPVPARADVTYVDDFKPSMYGFKTYRKGLKPADHALGKVLPAGVVTP